MAPTPVKLVYGGAMFGTAFPTPKEIGIVYDALKEAGVSTIDTAKIYGDSEELMGKTPGTKDFTIDTKWPSGFNPGSATKDGIISQADDSYKKLGVDKIDIFYLHAPDRDVDFAETLQGVDAVYKKGYFSRLGLSNFSADEVRQIYNYTKEHGIVQPSVYQGNYSAVARKIETELFPTLRELGISFYAYSPIAGGFLVKTRQQIEEGAGRFNEQTLGGMYNRLYNRSSYLEALDKWQATAKKEGVTAAELAYRWIGFHSKLSVEKGDAVIFGTSKVEQIPLTASYLKAGPLSEEAAKSVEEVWSLVESDAPLDNYEVFKPSDVPGNA